MTRVLFQPISPILSIVTCDTPTPEFAVTHSEALAYGGERTAVVVLPGDRWEIIDIGLIESVEGTNEPPPAVENREEER
jgi:hypothetical protein